MTKLNDFIRKYIIDLEEIEVLLDSDDDNSLIYMTDYNGNSCVHLCALYSNYNLLIRIIKKYPDTLQLVNNQGKTCIHILLNILSTNFSSEIINCIDKIFDIINELNNENSKMDKIDSDNYTVLHLLVELYNKDNKIYHLIEKIIKYCKINDNNMPILHYCIKTIKNIKLIKLLIDNKCDINGLDRRMMSPLIIALSENDINIIKLLLDYGADVNYAGINDEYLPINIAIRQKSNDIIELLLDHNPDMNHRDIDYNIPLHNALKINKLEQNINDKNMSILIEKSNLNTQNIIGKTCLHILAKMNQIIKWIDILKDKELDFFIEDKYSNTPLSYINCDVFIKILNIMTNKRIKDELNKAINIKCDHIDIEECRTLIKSQIISGNKINIKLPDILKKEITLFNSDFIHSTIYLIEILQKYDNIFVPYQSFIQDKCMNELLKLYELNLYKTPCGITLNEIIQIYTKELFEIRPYIILWYDSSINVSYKDLDFYVNKLLRIPKIRFILFKLTLIPNQNMAHANIIIYDKIKNQIERFEPYGNTKLFVKDNEKIDDYLQKLFKKIINKNIKYIGPKDFMTSSKFQLISAENNSRLHSDPVGFCLAWTLWFVELRLKNPDMNTQIMIDTALSNIIQNTEPSSKNNILEYIRTYSNKLDEYKNNFLSEIGINKMESHYTSYNYNIKRKILDHIIKSFNDLVKNLYK